MSEDKAPFCAWGKHSTDFSERRLLAGPRARLRELLSALKIFCEFIKGFRALHFIGPCVTVFGSARFTEDNPYYQQAREMGQKIGNAGFTVMTGGGPGIMEAANRGAREVQARSIGCNIILPKEQKPNPYVDKWIEFNYFFVRKVMLVKYSYAFVALPGGFGTLDEIFETLTLIQTGKIKNFPMILMGAEYWEPLIDFLKERLIKSKTIDETDLDRLVVTDSPQVAMDVILRFAGEQGVFTNIRRPSRWWLLSE